MYFQVILYSKLCIVLTYIRMYILYMLTSLVIAAIKKCNTNNFLKLIGIDLGGRKDLLKFEISLNKNPLIIYNHFENWYIYYTFICFLGHSSYNVF